MANLYNPLTQKGERGLNTSVYPPCAQVTRLITNHAPIGEHRKRFFPNEPTACPCGQAPLETRDHILYNCERYKQSWNPK